MREYRIVTAQHIERGFLLSSAVPDDPGTVEKQRHIIYAAAVERFPQYSAKEIVITVSEPYTAHDGDI